MYREGSIDRLAHIIGRAIPPGALKQALWHYYNRHMKFKSTTKAVEALIRCKRYHNGLLHICLKNGAMYAIQQKAGNNYEMYSEIYELLMEQYVMGIYEQNYYLQEGDTVVDIGAGWGVNTVDFSRKVGNRGKVIAIEPNEKSLVILKENLKLNQCINVEVVAKGVWDRQDILPFQIKERMAGNSLLSIGDKPTKIKKVQVDTVDNILNELGVGEVDLLKMDIEGAEIKALEGMSRILGKNGVRVVIASYHIIDRQPTYKTIIPTMEAIGFSTKFDSRNGIAYFEKITPVVGQA